MEANLKNSSKTMLSFVIGRQWLVYVAKRCVDTVMNICRFGHIGSDEGKTRSHDSSQRDATGTEGAGS